MTTHIKHAMTARSTGRNSHKNSAEENIVQSLNRRTMSVTFWPPNPNELDNAVSKATFLALLGT